MGNLAFTLFVVVMVLILACVYLGALEPISFVFGILSIGSLGLAVICGVIMAVLLLIDIWKN